MGLDHLSRLHLGESRGSIDNILLDAHLSRVEAMDDQFEDIATYLMIGIAPMELPTMQKKHLFTKSENYQLSASQLYKLRVDGILCRCILEHEGQDLLMEAHEGVSGGHYARKPTTHKVLCTGHWWPSISTM